MEVKSMARLTRSEAIKLARLQAKKRQETIYVLADDAEGGYTTATAEDMDTYFYGDVADFTVEPDGTIED
jgi:hypothetical protein